MKPLLESVKLAESTVASAKSGRMAIQVLSPGWGTSGYYSPAVCESAAELFTVGTQMFLDHPHMDGSGIDERGNRSVRDIAAVVTESGYWDPALRAVVAECRVTAPYRDLLADPEVAPHIGLSLRGSATDITVGEAEGRTGPIIEGLANIMSVDFVTRAGRGGKVLKVMESALSEAHAETFTEPAARLQLAEARNVGQWIESRLHLELTRIADDMFGDGRLTRPERISLSSAVGDALTAFVANLEAGAPDLYKRDLWAEPTALLAASEARHVPVTRPDSTKPTTEADQEVTMGNIQIEESVHTGLIEKAGRVDALESENATHKARITELEEADATRARLTRAAKIIAERAKEADVEFTALESRGLLAGLPLKDGDLDEAAFTTSVDESAAEKKTTTGAGKVRGFGGSTEVDESDDEDGEAFDLDKHLAESLGDLMPTAHQTKEA